MMSRMIAAAGLLATASAAGPNFMIFMPDDMEFYFEESPVPKYRGTAPVLEGMNRIREEGVVFKRAYAASTMCAPSRFSLLTGRYASRSEFIIEQAERTYRNDPTWDGRPSVTVHIAKIDGDDHQRTTATTLRDAGYRTIMSGKWHLAVSENQYQSDYPALIEHVKLSGFTDPVAVYYSNMEVGNQAADGTVYGHNLEWMVASSLEVVQDAVGKDEKFYLYFAPTAPHTPQPYDDMFLDERATPSGWLDEAPVTTMRSRAAIRAAGGNVAGTVAHLWVDEALIAMTEGLESLGVLDTTMIILCMDHGMGAKNQNYEGGSRILQVVRYPPLAVPGAVVSSVVSNVDTSATITDIAGVTPSYTVEGRSWKDDLRGSPPMDTVPKFIELGMDVSVVAGGFKFFSLGVYDTKAQSADGTYPYFFDCIQLYDITTDGGEQINLARDSDYGEDVARFEEYVSCHVAGVGECSMSNVENVQITVANYDTSDTQTGRLIAAVPRTCTPLPSSPPTPPTPPSTPTPPTPPTPEPSSGCEEISTRAECLAASCEETSSTCTWSPGSCTCPDTPPPSPPPTECSSFTTRRSCTAATCPDTSSPCTWSNRACSC